LSRSVVLHHKNNFKIKVGIEKESDLIFFYWICFISNCEMDKNTSEMLLNFMRHVKVMHRSEFLASFFLFSFWFYWNKNWCTKISF
jgi:hypothetical protein